MTKPKPLKPGDTVAFVAPASAVTRPGERDKLGRAVQFMEAMGLAVVLGDSCFARLSYLAGEDDLRAADLNRMFANPQIKGIFAVRGGYGVQRMLPLLNLDVIAQNPKIFAGYSDITSIHTVLGQCCGLMSYHALMPCHELCQPLDAFTRASFEKALFSDAPLGRVHNPPGMPLETLVPGRARGRLVGGTLTQIVSSIGTFYDVDTRGKILYFEDVDEPLYNIDRMMLHLCRTGKLRDAAGIILGQFTRCGGERTGDGMTLHRLLREYVASQGRPAIAGWAIGHTLPLLSVPAGGMVEIDASAPAITFLE